MATIPLTMKEFIDYLRSALGDPVDFRLESTFDGKLAIIFLASLTQRTEIQSNFLEPLHRLEAEKIDLITDHSWEPILKAIPEAGCAERRNMDEVLADLTTGRTVLYLDGISVTYSFDTVHGAKRQPTPPQFERTIRGSRLSFVENFHDNLSFIRQSINDVSLRIEGLRIGRRTKSEFAVLYLQDVADPQVVREVKRRLNQIKIDGVITIGYLEQLITDNRWSLFPLVQTTERPDKVVSAILEGRVAILDSGGSNAAIVPTTLNELYQSPEDYYWSLLFGSFLRFFRIMGNNLAVALPGLYIALLGVNPELLPIRFALTVSGSRMGVALPLVIELLLMEILVEIFREASLRLPITVSTTLGVTAGIVLGIAAVGAGIVSNATLVVVVVTAIASYSGPDYGIGLSWRIIKYFLIIMAALWGLFGLTIAGLVILGHAAMQNSFGVPFLSPWAPLYPAELNDTIIRRPIWQRWRAKIYHPQEKGRFYSRKGEDDNE